jgi:hypothetical protein
MFLKMPLHKNHIIAFLTKSYRNPTDMFHLCELIFYVILTDEKWLAKRSIRINGIVAGAFPLYEEDE